MNRRQILRGLGTCLPVGLAGCAGFGSNPDTPEGIEVDIYYPGNPMTDDEEPLKSLDRHDDTPESYQTILKRRSGADERLRDEEEITEIVRNTDFEDSYLLIVVAGWWSSSYDLELTRIERASFGLRVFFRTEEPTIGEVTMDEALHAVVIRVTDDEREVPEEVQVIVDGDESENTELTEG